METPGFFPEIFQDGPTLANTYQADRALRSCLRRMLPAEVFQEIEPGLWRLGERAKGDLWALMLEAEARPPTHQAFDSWGRRVDEVQTSPAWKALDRVAAEEALVATGYARKHGALSRIHQFARLYLYAPSSAYYACPLAMTDGAARALELYADAELKARAFPHLTSTDPASFWTSGQWMTERTGGSDVSETQTIARRDPESGHFRLYGTKFFTSAVTAQMAMTLARIEGAPAGSRGLSLFYLEPWDTEGKLRNIEVLRLKDKLGTRALPTAELRLNGAPARLVGDEGNGVKKISSLFNITRIYNACVAVTSMQRAIQLARDYAGKRRAFGKLLSEHPLHLETLAAMEAEASAGVQLVFRVAELLGKEETGQATPEESAVLRLLTPLAKLYTGKQAVAVTSEALECFGGAGYMEDTGIPRLLRDAQTLSIWEGTTNVLALDALRAIQKENAFAPFVADVRARLERVRKPLAVLPGVAKAKFALSRIEAYWPSALNEGLDSVQAGARQFAFALARAYMAALLLEQAQWSDKNEDPAQDGAYAVQVALRWCNQELAPLMHKE